jgi:hypothetical protein
VTKGRAKAAREKQARDKLAKAQKKLTELHGALARARVEGEEKVRIAQDRADRRTERVQKRVERAAHVVAQRESKLLVLAGPRSSTGTVNSPEATVAVLEQATSDQSNAHAMAEGPGDTTEMPLVQSDGDGGWHGDQQPSSDEHQGEGHWG